jgi:hypothetical protein
MISFRTSIYFLILCFFFFGGQRTSLAQNTEQRTVRLINKNEVKQLKEFLEKKDATFDIKTKKQIRPVYHLLVGPFNTPKQKLRLLSYLEKKRGQQKLINNRRYVYIGTYRTKKRATRIAKRLNLVRYGEARLYRVRKEVTVYEVKISQEGAYNDASNEVMTFSSPPGEQVNSSEVLESVDKTDSLWTTSFEGHSRLMGVSYLNQKESPTQLKLILSPEWKAQNKEAWQASIGVYTDAVLNLKDQNTDLKSSLHKTNLSYDFDSMTVTLGAQVLSWGRVYENSAFDLLSRQNLRHGSELGYDERLMSQWALRAKGYWSSLTVDFILSPYFQTHEYSPSGDLWSPVSRERGRIVGFPEQSILNQLVKSGSFKEDKIDRFATGLRLTHGLGGGSELGLTFARAPSQNPYYTINPEVVGRIFIGESISNAIVNSKEATFAIKYPTQLFFGLDGVSELFGNIYRAEIGWQSDRPATEKEGFIYSPQSALLWNLSTERYLNQGVNTLNVMLSGSKLLADKELLDFESTYFLGARYQWPFDRDRWLFEIESQIGLHAQHVNVRPRFSYQGIERQSFDLALNVFSGEEQTSANYFKDNFSVQLSWRYDL